MPKTSLIDRFFSPLGLTLLALAMLVPGIWELPLIDRDEPRFAHATVEMIDRDEWVVPYFNDEYRFDKPPLTYWWMRLNFKAFGINEFSARLHSVQSSWLIALLLFFFARQLGLDRRMAFLAGAGWLTALQVLIHSRLAVADMPLILFLVLTMLSLHKLTREDTRFGIQVALLSLWLGLGFLAKGPLAHAIPQVALLATFGLLWWSGRKALQDEEAQIKAQRKRLMRAQLAFLAAIVPSFILVAFWGIPALKETEGAYFGIGIGKHVVERGTGAMNQRLFIPGLYYFLIIIPFLVPWSAQLPATFKKSLRRDSLDTRFLLGWFTAPFLVFSFYATQLPHYILPGYPAFFLLLALTFRDRIELGKFGKIFRAVALALPAIVGLILVGVGLSQIPRGGEAAELAFLVFLIGGVMLSLSITAASLLRREFFARVATVSSLASFTVFFLLATFVARSNHLSLKLREVTGIPSGKFQSSGFKEPSLVWYFDDFKDADKRGIWDFEGLQDLTPQENSLTVMIRRRWRIDDDSWWPIVSLKKEIPTADDNREEIETLFDDGQLQNAQIVSGWSPATSSWIELLVLR